MSKEDPTIVVQPTREEQYLGGAGIVAAHASSTNSRARLVSVVGRDLSSKIVAKFLSKYDVNNSVINDASRKLQRKLG